MTMDSPPVKVFHNTSVTNGITGCSSLSSVSSTAASTAVVCCTPSANCTLASSTYQSQNSSQAKWYSDSTCPAELVAVERRIHLGANLFQPAQNPPVGVGQFRASGSGAGLRPLHEREPGGVEQLGGEVARRAGVVLADGQVAARAGAAGQGEAQRVGAELLDPVQRVDAVAARLAHLPAELVANQAVQEHILERHLRTAPAVERDGGIVGDERAEHHHPGHPEEQDVVAGHQHRGRIELRQVVGVVGPAQGGERPQRRREPGVEHVGVLLPPSGGVSSRSDAHAFRPSGPCQIGMRWPHHS